jgi:methionyl-tRNA formyltransferase
MEAGLDTGPVARVATTAIGPEETAGDLHDRLSLLGAETLVDTVAALEAGHVVLEPQPEEGVTYAARLEKAHGRIDWGVPAKRVHDLVRGTHPWPGAFVDRAEGPLKILAVRFRPGEPGGAPGTIVAHEAEGPRVACGEGSVILTRLQRAGRKPVSGAEFLRGAGADFAVGSSL